ncbi:MAG TPA: hypothetical protein DCS87_01410 [Rheinheimera sp.]|nr:hypothetical protein [Rheinheimera sp.]
MLLLPSIQPRSVGLIARFELNRLFATPRGWFALGAFAVVWYVILRYGIFEAAVQMKNPEVQQFLMQGIGMLGMNQILAWGEPEMMVFWLVTLTLLPFGVIFFASDQTCSDRARGTLRFLTLRTSRESIFIGRFVGQMLVQTVLISAAMLATLGMTAYRLEQVPLNLLLPALQIIINLLIVLLPFTALMALASALVKSNRMAISLVIFGGGVLLGLLGYLIYLQPSLQSLLAYLPGAQIGQLYKNAGWVTLDYADLPLIQTLVILAIGLLVMKEKNV